MHGALRVAGRGHGHVGMMRPAAEACRRTKVLLRRREMIIDEGADGSDARVDDDDADGDHVWRMRLARMAEGEIRGMSF